METFSCIVQHREKLIFCLLITLWAISILIIIMAILIRFHVKIARRTSISGDEFFFCNSVRVLEPQKRVGGGVNM